MPGKLISDARIYRIQFAADEEKTLKARSNSEIAFYEEGVRRAGCNRVIDVQAPCNNRAESLSRISLDYAEIAFIMNFTNMPRRSDRL